MTISSLWTGGRPLLLASMSPARRQLLQRSGIPVETEASGVDERSLEAAAEGDRLEPAELAARLAGEKALAVSRRHPERLVLGADQVLDLAGSVLHKPVRRETAKIHLQRLAGRTHALRSAAAFAREGRIVDAFVDSASLAMRSLTEDAIERYLDLVPPDVFGNAGVYQVEALGIHLFERIEGDHSTILGLPMIPCLDALRRLGALAF
jgi:septum formation protein